MAQAEKKSGFSGTAVVLVGLAVIVLALAAALFVQGGYLRAWQQERQAKVFDAPDPAAVTVTPPAIDPVAGASAWFPPEAATRAETVDRGFVIVYTLAAFAVVVVVGLAAIFILTFRRRDEAQTGAAAGPVRLPLLGLWVLGFCALAAFAFLTGFGGYVDGNVAPYGAYLVQVTARQGAWDFTYPGGHVADTLHVAVGRPVKLDLRTEDVPHGLAIPAVRVNAPILPDRTASTWFTAARADTYPLYANVYDGTAAGAPRSALVAQTPADFDAWLAAASDIFIGRTLAEVGELLYTRKGCTACHTTDGSPRVGPSFKDVYGSTVTASDGRTLVADDAYIRESILDPNAVVVAGFQPVMTPYAGLITDREIEAITAWLKTLSSFAATEQEGN